MSTSRMPRPTGARDPPSHKPRGSSDKSLVKALGLDQDSKAEDQLASLQHPLVSPQDMDSNASSIRKGENSSLDVNSPLKSTHLRSSTRPNHLPSALLDPEHTSIPISPGAPSPADSTASFRWAQVRDALIPQAPPSPRQSSTPLAAPSPHPSTPTPSTPYSAHQNLPKTSRLAARFGFRSAVEQARAAAQSDAARDFEEEIVRACKSAKSIMALGNPPEEREPSSVTFAPPALPFARQHQQQQSSGSSITGISSRIGRGLRRPPSIASMTTIAASPGGMVSQLILGQLHMVLAHYASIPNSSSFLPRQTEVFGVMLSPFMSKTLPAKRADEEHAVAVRLFEMIVGTWRNETSESEAERCVWCIRALISSPYSSVHRPRLFSILNKLLSPSSPRRILSSSSFQLIFQQLLLLSQNVSSSSLESKSKDVQFVHALIQRVKQGEFGELDEESLHMELGIAKGQDSDQDGVTVIREAIISGATVRLLRSAGESSRLWILHHAVEENWPLGSQRDLASGSSVLWQMTTRRLLVFTEFASDFLTSTSTLSSSEYLDGASKIAGILLPRIMPEFGSKIYDAPHTDHVYEREMNTRQSAVVKLVLRLFWAKSTAEVGARMIEAWRVHRSGTPKDGGIGSSRWNAALVTELGDMIAKEEPSHLVELLEHLYHGVTGQTREYIASIILPSLFDRLVTLPIIPFPALTALLEIFAVSHPKLFFKPLFTCAAASKDSTIVAQLRIIQAITAHVPDVLSRDPEMMAVALISDMGLVKMPTPIAGDNKPWLNSRIGQCVLINEVLLNVQKLFQEKGDVHLPPPSSRAAEIAFLGALETKLALLVDAKEQAALIPFSQRILLSVLLYRIRSYTQSSRPAQWLSRLVRWVSQCPPDTYTEEAVKETSRQSSGTAPVTIVSFNTIDEVESTLNKIGLIYTASAIPLRDTRPQSIMLSPSMSMDFATTDTSSTAWSDREKLRLQLPTHPAAAILPLLVAVSGQLEEPHLRILAPFIWNHALDSVDAVIVKPACFLFMLCVERATSHTLTLVENDVHSMESKTRAHAIQRCSILFSWRHQILSQTWIPDRNHKRPFKLASSPLSFIATDIGVARFVFAETHEASIAKLGTNLPSDIRRKLSELDWDKTAQEHADEKKIKWEQLPLSILPRYTLDFAEQEEAHPMVTSSDSHTSLTRRGSAAGYQAVKRRIVFVLPMASAAMSLLHLVHDMDPSVGLAARNFLLMVTRDDPGLFTRPLLESLLDITPNHAEGVHDLRRLVHLQAGISPLLSHHVFNHVAGFIKALSRDTKDPTAFTKYSASLSLISQLANHLNELTARDLRRNKVEPLLLPSFTLFFDDSAPEGPLFPRRSKLSSITSIPQTVLIDIIVVRAAQNMLLLRLLLRNPEEISAVRKNFARLQLPALDTPPILDMSWFIPIRNPTDRRVTPEDIKRRSLHLSRSYLLLATQIFRSLNRNLSDRAELAKILDGVNLVLLAHGDDLLIVGHALIAYMTASARFRRLFATSGGFLLFLPAIIKVYVEAEPDGSIQSAITYAIHRFFSLHDKTFVFQTVEVISLMLSHPNLDVAGRTWFSQNIFGLFTSLHSPYPPNASDPAGIHGSTSVEERMALIATVSEIPDALLTQVTAGRSSQDPNATLSSLAALIEKWKGDRFLVEDLVRLILTIIAHAPGALRAENFHRLLGHWAHPIYNGSASARTVLQQGVEALGQTLFSKTGPRTRQGDDAVPSQEPSYTMGLGLPDPVSSPSDPTTLRYEYLFLIAEVVREGGKLGNNALQRAFELIDQALQASDSRSRAMAEACIASLSDRYLGEDETHSAKVTLAFLSHISTLIQTHAAKVNLSSTFNAIITLLRNPATSTDRVLLRTVALQVCDPILQIFTVAAETHNIFDVKSRTSMIELLAISSSFPLIDVMRMIELRATSAAFLGGFIVPFCLSIPVHGGHKHYAADQAEEDIGRVWIRIVAYAMDACARTSGLVNEKRNSADSKASTVGREHAATVAMAIQIIKISVVRAGPHIACLLPGIWMRLAGFMREVLQDGELLFMSESQTPDISPLPSPSPSRPGSPQSFASIQRRSGSIHPPNSPSFGSHIPRRKLRVFDYILASTIEFIILYRSPLIIQLRLFIQQRLMKLHPHADGHRGHTMASPGSFSRSPNGRRDSYRMSMMAKRRSRLHPSPSSPDASPLLLAQDAPGAGPSFSLTPGGSEEPRRPGFALSRPSSLDLSGGTGGAIGGGRPILHLGPVAFGPSHLPTPDTTLRSAARSNYIVAHELLLASIKRVRVAQAWFGYGNEDVDVEVLPWSQMDALKNIREETRVLVEEFRESFYPSLGGAFADAGDVDLNDA